MAKTNKEFLKDLYYNKRVVFGIQKLYDYIVENHIDRHVTKKEIREFLNSQEVNQIHQKRKQKKDTKSIIGAFSNPNVALQIDLIELPVDKDFKFALVCVDIFSRYMFADKVKNKEKNTILKKLKSILNTEEGKGYKILSSDNGLEFQFSKKDLDDLNIKNHIKGAAFRPQSQSIVERANGTLKNMIKKNMSVNENKRWINILENSVDLYNETLHKNLLNYTPDDIHFGDEEILKDIRENNEKLVSKKQNDDAQIYKVNDKVRIMIENKKSKTDPNYSRDLFKIIDVRKSKSFNQLTTYKLMNTKTNAVMKGRVNSSQFIKIDTVEKAPKKYTKK